MSVADEGTSPGFLKRQVGPLPMWAWMGLAVGAGLALIGWRNAKNGSSSGSSSPSDQGVTQQYPDTLDPTYVFQNYDQEHTTVNLPPITVPNAPPGGGRIDVPTIHITDPPPTRPPTPAPTPAPAPPPAPAGKWVTVVPWKSGQPSGTPSTLFGIAQSVYGNSNGGQWPRIWNAPQNAAIVAKRGDVKKIQAGDRFWVPA